MECKQCKKTFKTANSLKQHRASKHSGKQPKMNNAPVATNRKRVSGQPRTSSVPGGSRVIHTEAVSLTLSKTTTTTSKSIPITPVGFTWLANLAAIYDKVVWNSIKLEFVPLLPTTNGGDVVMYFDVASNGAPSDFTSAYNMEGAKSGRLWDGLIHTAKASDLHSQKFYSTGESVTTESLLSTPGTYYVFATSTASLSETADVVIGRILIHYDITFYKPQNPASSTLYANQISDSGSALNERLYTAIRDVFDSRMVRSGDVLFGTPTGGMPVDILDGEINALLIQLGSPLRVYKHPEPEVPMELC